MNQIFIIDFDDTLFNTNDYKQARVHALTELGVSEEIFWNTYAKARNNEWGAFTYSDRRHAQVLAEEGFDEEKIFEALDGVNTDLKKFVFEDTIHFLESLKKLEAPLILLSLGDPETQEMKVHGAGIEKYFDRLFMVEETKEHIVKEITEKHAEAKIWFLNDKVSETQELVEKFPNITPVLRRSPAIAPEEYETVSFPSFSTLSEILKYVTKQ